MQNLLRTSVQENKIFQSLSSQTKSILLKKIMRYKKNDYLQFSTFEDTHISKQEFYILMSDLEDKKLVSKVLEVYSPYTKNSTGLILDEIIHFNDTLICDETNEDFEITPDNVKVKYKVII